MSDVTTVGLDLANKVLRVFGNDVWDQVICASSRDDGRQ
jgi:hypothetical protein